MFHKSHLDQAHHAAPQLAGSAMAGLGADAPTAAPSIPAPVPSTSDLLKKVAVVGGIALIVFFILRHLSKKK